ncbi:DUF5666 domain-containing protein [Variovorax sp. YR752]|uniref:DUF5666 domain-containing protein n=1 Tax=Variovorax sp. YR752 TaxID=1884383 RepID=UPI003137820C
MNIKRLAAMVTAAAVAVLAACGGGGSTGGIGGTGNNPDVAVGTITQFGSVWVNGIEYDTSDTTIRIDDNPGAQSDLRIGMVVRVDGSISGARAGEITVDGAVKGFVEQVIDANRMIVMGQLIEIDNTTRFENNVRPVVGNRVDVHGLVAGDGVISAGYIERKTTAPTPPFAVKGVVKNQNTIAQTFQIGTLTVVYANVTINDMPTGSWNGLEVEVKGSSCAAAPVCGTLNASQVEPNGIDVSGAEKAEVEGVVSAVTAGGFTLGGVQVATSATTRYEGGVAADLIVGSKVEVEGTVSGGRIAATKVSFRDAVRIEGDIASISGDTLTIAGVGGVSISVPSFAELRDVASVGDLAVGNHLRLRGKLGSGNSMVATRLELRSDTPDADLELQGPVTAFAAETSVTLLGVTVPTSAVSSYQNASGTTISRAAFFTALKVGTLAKAKGERIGATVSWNELELEN